MIKHILNVAEKPSVAKEVARLLSSDSFTKLSSQSKFNPVYTFTYKDQ